MWLPPINGVKQIPDAPRSESQILNSWYLNLPFEIFFYSSFFCWKYKKNYDYKLPLQLSDYSKKVCIISVYQPIQNLDRGKPKCELYIIIYLEILFSNWYIELLRMLFSYLSFMKIAVIGKIKVFFFWFIYSCILNWLIGSLILYFNVNISFLYLVIDVKKHV